MTPPLKIGLMVPINNTTMEGELTAWLPAGTQCKTLRIPRGKGMLTADSIPAYKANALELAKQFRAEGIDILAYGCTAASFIAGPAAETALTQELMDATGTPVVTTARAMVQALQDAHAQDIAVVTPYQDAVNNQIKAFLTDGGIRVRAFDSLYARDVDALGRIRADEVLRTVSTPNYRGRSAFPQPLQVAEIAVRDTAGVLDRDVLDVLLIRDGRAIPVKPGGTLPETKLLLLEVRHVDGRAWQVSVRREARPTARAESCGGEQLDFFVWRSMGVNEAVRWT